MTETNNTRLLASLIMIMTLNAMASGLYTPVVMQTLIPELLLGSYVATGISSHDIMFGMGFVILLSPAYILLAPVIGNVADQIGRKKVLAITLICSTLCYLTTYYALVINSAALLLLSAVLFGLGWCAFSLILATICDISSGKERLRNFARIFFAMIFVELIGQMTTNYFDFSSVLLRPVLIAFLLQIANLVILFSFMPLGQRKENVDPLMVALNNFTKNIFMALSSRHLARYLMLQMLFAFAWGIYFQNTYRFVSEYFHFNSTYAIFFQLYAAVIMLVNLVVLFPILRKRLKTSTLVIFATTLMLVGIAMPFMSNGPWVAWGSAIFTNISASIMMPLFWFLIAARSKPKLFGLTMGMSGSVWALAWSLSCVATYYLGINFVLLPQVVCFVLMLVCTVLLISTTLISRNNSLLHLEKGERHA